MQPRDKIGKSTWNIQESIKESVEAQVMAAVKSGHVKLDTQQLNVLMLVLKSAVEAGYQRSYNVFVKEVDKILIDDSPKPLKKK